MQGFEYIQNFLSNIFVVHLLVISITEKDRATTFPHLGASEM